MLMYYLYTPLARSFFNQTGLKSDCSLNNRNDWESRCGDCYAYSVSDKTLDHYMATH